ACRGQEAETAGRGSLRTESYASVNDECRCSSVAEQLIRNQQVVGSSPTAGSSPNQSLPERFPLRKAALVPLLIPDSRPACPGPRPAAVGLAPGCCPTRGCHPRGAGG